NFGEEYPNYPAFRLAREPISEVARPVSAMEAIRHIGGRQRTNLAITVLSGLNLLDDDERVKPLGSPYARYLLELLLAKGETLVVNHGEVIDQVAGGLQPIYKEAHFKLEPEWVAVVLLALVYDGHIVLNLGGTEELDAGTVERATVKAIADLSEFRFYKRPRSLPLVIWQQIFDGLGLQSGLLRDENERDGAVRTLQQLVQRELPDVVQLQAQVNRGFTLWNAPLFTDRLDLRSQDGTVVSHSALPGITLSTTDILPALRATKDFLEKLGRYNTAGKLRNLTITAAEAHDAINYRKQVDRIKKVVAVVDQLQAIASYLSEASVLLPAADPWVTEAQTLRRELLNALRAMAKGDATVSGATWQQTLEALKERYRTQYA
ncbi:MAG: hypothetical protein KDE31_12145, partial [Caldilineaceae bacterium]|nr:hypothetical protein [Caldilineaceae bacterium]